MLQRGQLDVDVERGPMQVLSVEELNLEDLLGGALAELRVIIISAGDLDVNSRLLAREEERAIRPLSEKM